MGDGDYNISGKGFITLEQGFPKCGCRADLALVHILFGSMHDLNICIMYNLYLLSHVAAGHVNLLERRWLSI